MNHDSFRPLLLRCAVAVMACDGEVHEAEIAELRRMVDELPHFAGTDPDAEVSGVLEALLADLDGGTRALMADVRAAPLKEGQRALALEALLNVVGADGVVHSAEATYVRALKGALGVTDEAFIVRFPAHVDLLFGDAADEGAGEFAALDGPVVDPAGP